jgi:hypothetical protein
MVVEPALVNSTAALVGAAIGGTASLAAAAYGQWYHDRLQRIVREADKREAIYGEFIMSASKVLVGAYISDSLSLTRDELHLVGLINRMRLFAPAHIVTEAENVIRNLIDIAQQPRLSAQELAKMAFTDRSIQDALLTFSLATQADLKAVYGHPQSKGFLSPLGLGRFVSGVATNIRSCWFAAPEKTREGICGAARHEESDEMSSMREC